jgi:hypothetical protein
MVLRYDKPGQDSRMPGRTDSLQDKAARENKNLHGISSCDEGGKVREGYPHENGQNNLRVRVRVQGLGTRV